MNDDVAICSHASASQGQPLYGTAVQVDVWLCLEYRDAWRAKAMAENDLPPAVNDWLKQSVARLEAVGLKARPQFVRRGRDTGGDPLHFFIARSGPHQCQVWQFNSMRYEDFVDIDPLSVLQDEGAWVNYLREEPLYLVCTNGKRDRCCASLGMPVYNRFAELAPEASWQTTHLGGHRFAATLQVFPDGLCYGRVGPADVERIIEAQAEGRILLDRLRGRTAFSPAMQAAEYFLREQAGRDRLTDYYLETAEPHSGRFLDIIAGKSLEITVAPVEPALRLPASCGDENAKPVETFRLVQIA